MFFEQTSFSSMLVKNDPNFIVAKMFSTHTVITEKSLWGITFQSVTLHVYVLILEDKTKYLYVVL